MKNTKGITLVALVITIIILLILAGITISQLTGSGLFEKAQLAEEKTKNAQDKEDGILSDYENQILSASRNNNIKNDLNVKATIENQITANIKVEVQEIYENAVYIYIVNDKIISHLDTNSTMIENIEFEKNHNIVAIVVEGNGNIHRGTTNIAIKENIDVFGKISESGKTLSDFGITYTRSGSSEIVYNELYNLGMGSGKGINRNTFTLNIDYQTLCSQLENKQFKGIYGQFYQSCGTTSGSWTSWVYSDIIITYEDNTTSTVSTQKITATNTTKTEQPYAIIEFEEGKNISKIQMIINMYDADYGSAFGYIKNIGLVP